MHMQAVWGCDAAVLSAGGEICEESGGGSPTLLNRRGAEQHRRPDSTPEARCSVQMPSPETSDELPGREHVRGPWLQQSSPAGP